MTQKEEVKKHLKTGKSITPIEALGLFGCYRLASVIFDLREEGMSIRTEPVKQVGKRYARYWLDA